MGTASPSPPGARARVSLPCSPVLRQERRRAVTVAAPPRRQLRSPASRRAPPPPQHSLDLVGSVPPAPPCQRPRRRREHAGAERPGHVEAGQGLIHEKETFSRDPSA
jgi:hypothetical protein